MSRECVLQWLQRQPFQPFQVLFSNGDALVVRHRECAALSQNNLIIVNPDSDRSVTCPLVHIASIAPVPVELRDEVYARLKIEEGLRQLDAGEGIPHEEVQRRVARWLK